MIVHQIPVGPMQNFSYIVSDEDTSESIIIDPSWNLMELELIIKNNNNGQQETTNKLRELSKALREGQRL